MGAIEPDSGGASALPRCLPEIAFPPYTYVPGQTPHPVREPGGHAFGVDEKPFIASPEPWQRCHEYLRGVDLFNHGYYWEAHEAWEAVWHAAGRSGPTAHFLKGLIKLAAAGVKTRAGSATGRQRHCRRAAELFQQVHGGRGEGGGTEAVTLMGLSLDALARWATQAEGDATSIESESHPPRVFSFVLLPDGFRNPG